VSGFTDFAMNRYVCAGREDGKKATVSRATTVMRERGFVYQSERQPSVIKEIVITRNGNR
jgi:hypothetical protein